MNIGAQSGLIDPKHEAALGNAVWLYLWFLWRQTKGSGLVLGGMPLTYFEIATRSGFNERKVRRWLEVIRESGYVEVTHLNYKKMQIRVLKSKKFHFKQMPLPLPENGQSSLPENGQSSRPKTGNMTTKNGQSKQSGMLRGTKPEEPKEAEERNVTAAFTSLGFDKPFGQPKFQAIWTKHFQASTASGEWLNLAMEDAIQECQAAKVGVPPQFFTAKREVEKWDKAEFDRKYHRTPL